MLLMKKIYSLFTLLLLSLCVSAQVFDPVSFKTDFKKLADDEAEIVFTAVIESDWHLYSTYLGGGVPPSASFYIDQMDVVELVGTLLTVGASVSNYHNLFVLPVRYF